MKVFDLCCEQGHRFEGWFGAEGDFETQSARRLLACPICESTEVVKMPSAPHLNLLSSSNAAVSGRQAALGEREREQRARHAAGQREPHNEHRQSEPGEAPQSSAVQAGAAALGAGPTAAQQASWLRAVREVLAQTENVGEQFAEEARRIHYNEAPARPIRGVASLEETQSLADEGIEVMSLPMPAALKETLQ
ncbi:MAG: DUF1178 family protein [Janthinobacterium lividum]